MARQMAAMRTLAGSDSARGFDVAAAFADIVAETAKALALDQASLAMVEPADGTSRISVQIAGEIEGEDTDR